MQIDTRSTLFAVSNSANATNTSITFPVPTTTSPDQGTFAANKGDGVISCGGPTGSLASNSLLLVPYGVGSSTNTLLMNAYGWRKVPAIATGQADLWVAYELATFTCTLCTVPGIANTQVNASQLFCGTITLGVGNANISNEIISPTGNVVAHIVLDVKGSMFVELRFSTNSSATSMNCLYATL